MSGDGIVPPHIADQIGQRAIIRTAAGEEQIVTLIACLPEPAVLVEDQHGERRMYRASAVQPKPLRERIADLLGADHDPMVTEGGCGWYVRNNGDIDRNTGDLIDKIIALVRAESLVRAEL